MCSMYIDLCLYVNKSTKLGFRFTKDAQWQISAEKAWKVIFAPDLIEYAFVGASLSDTTFMGGEH